MCVFVNAPIFLSSMGLLSHACIVDHPNPLLSVKLTTYIIFNRTLQNFLRLIDKSKKRRNTGRVSEEDHGDERRPWNKPRAAIKDQDPELDNKISASYIALKRKAENYDRMTRNGGNDGNDDDSEDEEDESLVDFGLKRFIQENVNNSGDGGQDGSGSAVMINPVSGLVIGDDEDPWIELTDDFGRTRVVRQSQAKSMTDRTPEFVEESLLEEPVEGFKNNEETAGMQAIYLREQDRESKRQQIPETYKSIYNQKPHFESNREIRQLGVGFYQFSHDEKERKTQQEGLKKIRATTELGQAHDTKASRAAALESRKSKIRKLRNKKKDVDDEDEKVDQGLKTYLEEMQLRALQEIEKEKMAEAVKARDERYAMNAKRIDTREWNEDNLYQDV